MLKRNSAGDGGNYMQETDDHPWKMGSEIEYARVTLCDLAFYYKNGIKKQD